MQNKLNEALAAMRAEVARQNERWAEAKTKLLAMGDCVLAVPRDALVRIDAVCAPPIDQIAHPVIRA
jgi:hypothetical protein